MPTNDEPTPQRLHSDSHLVESAAPTAAEHDVPPSEHDAPPSENTAPPSENDALDQPLQPLPTTKPSLPKKKGWFSHTFFLVMVTFAMCMSAVNTWIGPDERFVSHEMAGEEPARQQEVLTKIVLRLRRAELLMNRDRIKQAKENLSEALLFMKENNRILPLIASDVQTTDFKEPWSPKYKHLLEMYEQKQMYRQEANLMKDIDAEMVSAAVLVGPTKEFYQHAVEINKRLGDQTEAQRYLDKLDRWDLVPHKIHQTGTAIDFNQACRDLLDGDFDKARTGFQQLVDLPAKSDRFDSRYDHNYRVRSQVMLALIPVAEHKRGLEIDKSLDEALAQMEQLGEEAYGAREVRLALEIAIYRNQHPKYGK